VQPDRLDHGYDQRDDADDRQEIGISDRGFR
jgi:hypothetical protein